MNILADASLPNLREIFLAPFQLTLYHDTQELLSLLSGQDVLLCRSTLKVNESLLKNSSLRIVATASSGTDHIDEDYLAANQIKLLHARGSNALAVRDYILACVAYLQTHRLFLGSRVGVIGLGAVGQAVALQFKTMGLTVVGYDPLKAYHDKQFHSATLSELWECDLLCIHANLHTTHPYPSHHLLNRDFLEKLRKHVVIINAARGNIVNEHDLLHVDSSLIYCTDVYANEPNIDPSIIERATLCSPHIAGHSIEAKYQSVVQIAQALYAEVQQRFPSTIIVNPQISPIDLPKYWQKRVLSIYNPWLETSKLKQARDKKAAFCALRAAHQVRHDFHWYHLT